MTFILLLIFLMQDYEPAGSGIMSMYEPWDTKSKTVPYGHYAGSWNIAPSQSDLVCAHRTFKFHTRLKLTTKDNQTAYCTVLDRGPYGACVPLSTPGRRPAVASKQCPKGFTYKIIKYKKNMPRGGYYRGVLDATPLVHHQLKSRGWIWVNIKRAARLKKTGR